MSEKGFEILFNRFALNKFNLGELVLYAPTSYEEFTNGYDTKITGLETFREIILQFKSAAINKKGDLFTAQITKHQHEILNKYDSDTAYYILPTFESIKELNKIQASLKSSNDFLKYCICIDASKLPEQVDFIQYRKPDSHKESPLIKYKIPEDGKVKKAKHNIKGNAWCRGSTLLDKFKSNSNGTVFSTSGSGTTPRTAYGTSASGAVFDTSASLIRKLPNLDQLGNSDQQGRKGFTPVQLRKIPDYSG